MKAKNIKFSIPLAITALFGISTVTSAAVIPFSSGDEFNSSGNSFTVTTEVDPSPPMVETPGYATNCDQPIMGPSFPLSFDGVNFTECAALGGSSKMVISDNNLNVTGGYSPFLGLDGKFVAFGPTVTEAPPDPNFTTIFTADNGTETLTIEVDTNSFTATTPPGENAPITFTYKSMSTVTDGVDTTTSMGLFEFTTQSALIVDNVAVDEGIYNFAAPVKAWSNTIIVEKTPEPSIILGLGLVSLLGFSRKKIK